MNDPRQTEALDPRPPGSAGERLWQMATARLGLDIQQWRAYAARVNACLGSQWRPQEARPFVEGLVATSGEGYSIVCCGREIATMAGCPESPLEWRRLSSGCEVAYLPHPSGLCRWYNDPVHLAAAEIFLEETWHSRMS